MPVMGKWKESEKLVPFPFYPPQISQRLAWNRAEASTARG